MLAEIVIPKESWISFNESLGFERTGFCAYTRPAGSGNVTSPISSAVLPRDSRTVLPFALRAPFMPAGPIAEPVFPQWALMGIPQ